MEEFEKLKTILEETEKANRLKVQRKIRENESLQLKKLEQILLKEQKELNDLKVRYQKIHNEFKMFYQDSCNKIYYLNGLVKENDEYPTIFFYKKKEYHNNE